jgi:hypothetical protein
MTQLTFTDGNKRCHNHIDRPLAQTNSTVAQILSGLALKVGGSEDLMDKKPNHHFLIVIFLRNNITVSWYGYSNCG